MAPRRKKRRSRARKTFSVPLIETGAGIALVSQSQIGAHLKTALEGNVQGGLEGLAASIQTNKNQNDQDARYSVFSKASRKRLWRI